LYVRLIQKRTNLGSNAECCRIGLVVRCQVANDVLIDVAVIPKLVNRMANFVQITYQDRTPEPETVQVSLADNLIRQRSPRGKRQTDDASKHSEKGWRERQSWWKNGKAEQDQQRQTHPVEQSPPVASCITGSIGRQRIEAEQNHGNDCRRQRPDSGEVRKKRSEQEHGAEDERPIHRV
jgi:hypothetical protein